MFTKQFKNLCLTVICLSFAMQVTLANAQPKIEFWQTHNGARVYFIHTPQLPIVDIGVVFAAGSAYDGNQFGLSALTNDVLSQAAAGLSADQIAAGFDQVGAVFDTANSRESATLSLRSLTDPKLLTPALTLFTQVLNQPTFAETGFKREQASQLVAIKSQLESPDSVASNALYQAIYPNHPYGHAIIGETETVQRLTANDCRQFYQHYYVANNAVVGIVGNVSTLAAKKIAEQIIGALPAGKAADVIPAQPIANKSVSDRIPFPSTQTNIRLGQIGITRHNPEYYPLIIGNYVFGGSGLTSRLFKQIRDVHGLSYDAYSYFVPLSSKGPFIISLGTRNAKAQQALTITQELLQTYVQQGPTADEVAKAKKYLTGSFPLYFASNKDLLSNLLMLGFYKLPLDYFDTYVSKVNAVTLPQITQALQQTIKPNQLVTVLVGEQSP